MKIAIIGTGSVGSTLGQRLGEQGHKIVYGSREPGQAKVKQVVKSTPGAESLSIKEAVLQSDLIFLAVPWKAVQATIKSAGDFKGKILVDCTNPLSSDLKELDLPQGTSATQQIASWAKGAMVVKAFNTVGVDIMRDPNFLNAKATMLICGDEPNAKKTVKTLAEELGFDVIDAGPLLTARSLEQVALLWIHLAVFQRMGTNFAFGLLKR